MLNRFVAPATPHIPHLRLPLPAVSSLNDQIPLFTYANPHYPVILLDIIWRAGDWYGPQAVPYLTGKMLFKGTPHRNALQIATHLEQYGAQLSLRIDKEVIHIQLSSIPRHFPKLLPTLTDALLAPTFPHDPLATLQSIVSQKIAQKNADPSFLARKILKQLIFSTHHPYGQTLTQDTISSTTPATLQAHYHAYAWHQPILVISGQVEASHIQALHTHLAAITPPQAHTPTYPHTPTPPSEHTIIHPSSLQTTLAIGHPTITQSHPAYPALFITNTLLGGYFGSRLMRQVREEKGYTYGIYSRLISHIQDAYWYIIASVKKETEQAARQAIIATVRELQTTPIDHEELAILKNYLTGHLITLFQTPLALASRFIHAHLHGLSISYYDQLYHIIHTITAEEIQATAQRFFDTQQLHVARIIPPQAQS